MIFSDDYDSLRLTADSRHSPRRSASDPRGGYELDCRRRHRRRSRHATFAVRFPSVCRRVRQRVLCVTRGSVNPAPAEGRFCQFGKWGLEGKTPLFKQGN